MMLKELKEKMLPTLSVPLGLALILVPFSLLTEWNMFTVLFFWFIITPVSAEYLPTILSKRRSLLGESLLGMLISYSIMVFMIYDHYNTDMFLIIIVSCLINLGAVTIISKVKRGSSES